MGNTWTPEHTNAKFPKLMFNGTWNFVRSNCDYLYRDASYFSLKTINVGYTLPKRWTSKICIESLSSSPPTTSTSPPRIRASTRVPLTQDRTHSGSRRRRPLLSVLR